MVNHNEISNLDVIKQIKQTKICFGGNRKLKIYGTLQCKSGKRMKRENRVFFISEKEAIAKGYRPCGHCMNIEYKKWKTSHGVI